MPGNPTSKNFKQQPPVSNEERLRIITDNLQDIICAYDRWGKLAYVTPSVKNILDYEPNTLLGKEYLSLIHPFDAAKLRSFNFIKNLLTGEIDKFEMRIKTYKGEYVWLETLIKFIRDDRGRTLEIITTSRDVTPRKVSEEEIQRLTLNLENIVQERTAQLIKTNESLFREIEERKAAEKALKKSAEFYHAVSELASDYIYIVLTGKDGRMKVDWMSDSLASLTSHDKPGAADIDQISKILHPDDMKPYLQAKQRIADTGKGEDIEYRIMTAGGKTRYLIEHNLPVFDPLKNRVARIYSAAADITERREFINQLMNLNMAIEASTDYVFITDKEFKIEYCNKAFEYLIERPRAEIIGKEPREVLSMEEASEDFLKTFFQSLMSRKPFRFEAKGRKKNGDIYYTEELVAPVFDDKGELAHYISTGRNITERKKAENELNTYKNHLEKLVEERTAELTLTNDRLIDEIDERITIAEALQESENRLRLITDNIQDLICVNDTTGMIQYISHSVYSLLGMRPEELIGASAYDLIHPDDLPGIFQKRMDNISKRSVYKIEYRLRNKQGNYIWMESIIKNIFDASGSITEVQSSSRDITHRKTAEEEVLRAYEQEKKLNELKSRLVSTISHEFRTPLTSIFASAEMLERYVNKWSDEKKLENIRRIQKSVEHMIEMLNETLSISKADAGKIAFTPQRFEAVSLCRTILDEIAPIKGDGHKLTLICGDDQLFCSQDNKLLATVLTNLISNAIKYSPQGGEIKLSLEKTDSGIRYTVADQGIGIEENDLREIFQPFFRGKNIGGIKGTGLGLSIVKKYLEIIGGVIEIKSELGKGTAIVVDVPAIN